MAATKEARVAAECVAVDRTHHVVWNQDVALDFFSHLAHFEDVLEANLEIFCGETEDGLLM